MEKKGFTLLELLIVIAILALLAGIGIPSYFSAKEKAQAAVDMASVRTLNSVTAVYKYTYEKTGADIFEGFDLDVDRMQELVDKGFFQEPVLPVQADTEFQWRVDAQAWTAYRDGEALPLTQFGSTFPEIYTGMVDYKRAYALEHGGSYGRDWGDYRYTDIELDPEDWKNPVDHAYYKPAGKLLRIVPEAGYVFVFKDIQGNPVTFNSAWDLIYNFPDETWYYHRVDTGPKIDISTVEIIKKQD